MCPSGDCKAVSHLSCLATDFLSSDSSQSSGLLPRGGNCKSCRSCVLWGNVIRGCYRRHQGGKAPQLEESDREDDIEAEAQSDDSTEDSVPMIPVMPVPKKASRVRTATGETAKRPRGRPPKKTPGSAKVVTKRAATVAKDDSEGENFDIGGFTDLDDSESEVERRLPKPTPVRKRK